MRREVLIAVNIRRRQRMQQDVLGRDLPVGRGQLASPKVDAICSVVVETGNPDSTLQDTILEDFAQKYEM